jgi:hypothetical protein
MRVDLIDPWGVTRSISSYKPGIISLWLHEYVPLMNVQGWTIKIQPETAEEQRNVKSETSYIDAKMLSKLATKIGDKKYMATARWCDFHNHPYRAPDDPDDINVVKFGGKEKEICPECAAEVGLNDDYSAPESPVVRHAAITSSKGK